MAGREGGRERENDVKISGPQAASVFRFERASGANRMQRAARTTLIVQVLVGARRIQKRERRVPSPDIDSEEVDAIRDQRPGRFQKLRDW